MSEGRGNVMAGMGWMLGMSVALAWMPVVGPLVAGFVGGRKAGTIGAALLAAILPVFLFMAIAGFLGALLGWIPIIGQLWAVVAGLGGWVISTASGLPLLIGAMIGAATR
jgi:hypothetical protein